MTNDKNGIPADNGDESARISEIAKTTQEIQKIPVISALLGPTAKILGDRLAIWVNQKFSPEQEKNLTSHVDAVTHRSTPKEGITLNATKIAGLIEWVGEAKDVNEESAPNLSEAWRIALLEALDENFELLKVLPKLSESELVKLKNGDRISQELLDKLKKIELIEIKDVDVPKKIFGTDVSEIAVSGAVLLSFLFLLDYNIDIGIGLYAISGWFLIVIMALLSYRISELTKKTMSKWEYTIKGAYIFKKLGFEVDVWIFRGGGGYTPAHDPEE